MLNANKNCEKGKKKKNKKKKKKKKKWNVGLPT